MAIGDIPVLGGEIRGGYTILRGQKSQGRDGDGERESKNEIKGPKRLVSGVHYLMKYFCSPDLLV